MLILTLIFKKILLGLPDRGPMKNRKELFEIFRANSQGKNDILRAN